MKIYTAAPLPLSRESWTRDITVIFRGFQALGNDAACVRLFSKDGSDFPGVLQLPIDEMQSAGWWQEQACDLVVANTWGQPKHNALVEAIKASGAKVLVRLDSDGFNSPWNGFWHYGTGTYHIFRDKTPRLVAAIKAFAKTFIYAIPRVYDEKMLDHLSLADAIGIESEGAYRLFSRLLQFYKREDLVGKLHVIRHPVVPEIDGMSVPSASERANVIIGVGRWDSPQKDTPLLIATLSKVLANNPDWEAHLYGRGEKTIRSLLKRVPESIKARVHILGPRPHEEILHAYQFAKTCLFTSRYEGCPIAGEEALCLGCTLVGPPDVPSMQDLCAADFGTLPSSRRRVDMATAVQCEINLWESGKRVPQQIAGIGRELFLPKHVCQTILEKAGSTRRMD